MQNSDSLKLEAPSLPKGGGAITGLKGDIAPAGPDGAATLSLALPISAGRGYAPSLTLSYHSRNGNGPFGIGWNISLPAIRRRIHNGVPEYDESDQFTGPDGEVLVPELTAKGTAKTRTARSLPGIDLPGIHRVYAYRSRLESDFSRLEHWLPEESTGADFWVIYSPDGQVHLMGYSPQARLYDPENTVRTAVWLLESSVSMTGEQIYYQYRAEDNIGCEEDENTAHPHATAQRYLVAAWYGNRKAGRFLPGTGEEPVAGDWLFVVVLDYGEREANSAVATDWIAPGKGSWHCRQDRFSGYQYGFDLRTRRLCRQVLMYHAVTALDGIEKTGDEPQLVTRLLLDYDQSPSVTTLKNVRQIAYEADSRQCEMPPLTFDWQRFTPPLAGRVEWQQRDDLAKMNLLQPYQMVDLDGEGVAGILYQDNGAWWYRAPIRKPDAEADAVTWDKARKLPTTPSLRGDGILADLNGDGYLEWMVTSPGLAGSYHRTPERDWQHFAPLSALPVEYAHPQIQLADITGNGLVDLVLIGPKSLRLYTGNGNGWEKAQTIMLSPDITLPVPDSNARVMVAFSDMAGSGQQQLTEIRAEGVRYWPNLGHGRFGAPVCMAGFSQPLASFNPDQLYMADTDGSGTTDLIYTFSDHLLLYRNQSGNHFAEPFTVRLPAGVRYDRTCSLQLADVQGLGISSLLLTVPHPVPRHWICHLSDRKPWLLNQQNNSMGARQSLDYRSSAQFWLDQKADAAAAGKPTPVSYLPLVLHTLCRTTTEDEITGNRLVSSVSYRHGVWDGLEGEFRGFGSVVVIDTDTVASQGTAEEITLPAISRNWYATGLPAVDQHLSDEYWRGDVAAFPDFTPRFTTGHSDDERVYVPDESTIFWLNRGVKGQLLRSELYGADGSQQAEVPYLINEMRPQVRLVEAAGDYPVVWTSVVESRSWTYERISSDPQCSQQVLLTSDEYGQPLRRTNINYPRRSKPQINPYPDTLPDTLFASSYDPQQQVLYLSLEQNRWHNLTLPEEGIWLPGVADATRSDTFVHTASVAGRGLTLEYLLSSDSLVAEGQPYTFTGQQQIWYLDGRGEATTDTPAFPPRVAFIETAVLDEKMVSALSATLTDDTLAKAGYSAAAYLFPRRGEATARLQTARRSYTTYAAAEHFYLPVSQRDTLLTGAVTVTRDVHNCVIIRMQDAAGLTTTAEYDWRFLTPVRVTDVNDNVHLITLDAHGRVTSLRFSGTEGGRLTGYSDATMAMPATAEDALALKSPLPVAQYQAYVLDSWMQQGAEKQPPHAVTLSTDRYDSDPQQQIRQQVVFSDGFGRVLQTAARQSNGEAWQRAANGSLAVGPDGVPVISNTSYRWAVSGRTEYDNKGQVVRTYQPYFLNDWKYISDDSARRDLFADTHYYDPIGRERQVVTAKGWLRRTLFTPWFVVSEDENDTAAERSTV
ncbi:SpvB/TcaC N-terminal domain-containing protein [Erwinia mallotivora]|uniref:SpvB/TcaC N-terminal domain-containing protein n=1 Tax=Erwinia mallotivora TaxID=69222 RepID=UPI0021C0DD65|nr:SpvB/TcaC N-terminal domain-containing protein [Erwinia mallotivora]